ncbi:MAG: cupin domain-containing protein [Bacteroidota bacterium]|nr:cupin domain-containing protein [Bacteroidota bacterium]
MIITETKNTGNPDEVAYFPKGKVELFSIGGTIVGRATLAPGWRWSTSVKPMVKTDTCQAAHFQYLISGTLMVLMDNGTRIECKAGDISFITPGHDEWVVGNEPVVVIDFQGMADFAKR